MKQLKLGTLLCLIGFQLITNATPLTDSLKLQLTGKADTNQVKLLSELCWQYCTLATDTAIVYGNKAVSMALTLNDSNHIAQAYNDLGIAHYYAGHFNEAIAAYEQSLAIRLKLGNVRNVAAVYNKLGIVYQKLSKFTEALYYNLLALKLFESIGYNMGVSYGYNNIAIINQNLGDYKKALFYHERSLAIKQKMNDSNGLAGSYSNMANIYRQLHQFDQALIYYNKALAMLTYTKDMEYLSSTYNNLGETYVMMEKPKQAIPNLLKGIAIREKNTDVKALVSSYINMADAYALLNNAKEERYYLEKAKMLSKQLPGMREQAVLYLKLANAAYQLKDYQSASRYYQQQIALNDSLLNEEVVRKVAEMETLYETEKKEALNTVLLQENKIQQLAIATKRFQLGLLAGVLALVLVTSFLVYSRYKHKKEQELITTKIYAEQQRLQSMIATQEEERKRISGELHDGIGQLLSVVRMNLSVIEQQNVSTNINQTIHLLDNACNELRTISHQLMPAVLINKGIGGALAELISNLSKASKLHIDYYADPLDGLKPEQEIHLFRIIQELLNNAVKYAEATELHLTLHIEGNALKVMVSDNGKGFDTKLVTTGTGNGWHNISTRTRLLNGVLDIESAPKQGTSVFIEIPITPN
ncbi:MAG: sensor histidine kinase [Bacteroidia bacterium]|jgi:signal transduction histidine kinase|nr:sensor histidine kinase [Bacteroidia bacterium]